MLILATVTSALLGGRPGSQPPRPARAAWVGLGLLALFVAWTGLSLTWSIVPDRSWAEFNRVLAYLLLTGVGVLLGAADPRAVERFAGGFLVVVAIVAVYALGGKIAPGLNIDGLLDLNQTADIARLRAPLEYWNALGLLCALAAPIAVRLATDPGRSRPVRLAALEAVYLLAVVVGLTYSRGAVAAFLVGAAVLTAFGSGRLRGLLVMAAATLAAAAPLAVAFGSDGLTANGAPLGERIADGRILGLVFALAAGALLAAGMGLLRMEPRGIASWSGARTRRLFRLAGAGAAVLIVLGGLGLARSQGGFTGRLDQAVEDFTEVREDRQYDPVRLVSTNSGTRWSWWKEAAGAWSDRPVAGWGAGSFALLHLRYRHDELQVTQAHSMPMQLLAETGLVGLLLAYGAVLALLAAAIARTRPATGDRNLAVALLAASAAWLVHGFYDWDFVIPAVTAPVLVMLGLLAGRRGPERLDEPAIADDLGPGYPPRVAIVALTTLLCLAAIISAGLPWLAGRKAVDAAEATASRTPQALEEAAAQADLAARLNPLATRPLFVSAAVAARRGRLLEARAALLEAVDRTPDDPQAWGRLAGLALRLADYEGFVRATQRQYTLDPQHPAAERLLSIAEQLRTLPANSASATGTPLTAGTSAPVPPPG